MPHLKLTAPSGADWEYGEDDVENRIKGPAVAFAPVVARTGTSRTPTFALPGRLRRSGWRTRGASPALPRPRLRPAPARSPRMFEDALGRESGLR